MAKAEDKNIINQIINAIHLYPDNVAFVIEEESYTYKQLGKRIAGILTLLIASEEKRIGILAEDSLDTYAAILAVLISGKTYVILHPGFPPERNKKIIKLADLKLILGTKYPDWIVIEKNSYIFLSTTQIESLSFNNISFAEKTNEYAYIIFTSGSTGEPKGVPISRNNLNAFYKAYDEIGWNLSKDDRMLQMFELTFDVSIVSFLYPLTLGASTYTVGYGDVKHFKVIEILEKYALTFAAVTPSLLQLLSPYFFEIYLPALKYLIVTAEASPVNIIEKFHFSAPNAQFINLYGPTEATIYCSCYKVPLNDKCKHYNGMLAIGKPFNGIDVIIADSKNRRLPAGEKGELWVSGAQIMEGYLNDKEKSDLSLIHYYNDRTYYKTGDLCILDKDGDLIYCGRKDHQVKIQGYRIELSEIEYTAKNYFRNSKNAVVIPINGSMGSELYLIFEGEKCEESDIYNYLQIKLPSYMIPKKIYFIDKFPLTNSNKIDRKKISELFNNRD